MTILDNDENDVAEDDNVTAVAATSLDEGNNDDDSGEDDAQCIDAWRRNRWR